MTYQQARFMENIEHSQPYSFSLKQKKLIVCK